ncbi:hypothetical protein DFQ01_12843 [Paenibacillus cellulosilyticus]|uniref:Uncharacterized protein n=1 Tax=Paenibacillus cellulosilyticus TaxID=375489 RepID=A0A2V2YLZ5_9BACL|nr:hypothetical protein [Paenibacillus cellulosilyticus]PWV95330.1 hypothetical protein DFQ01_12843 [Paenibacillus cellulosilyticus]QKS44057.1 hypothetical protein HUB94_06165 [Paenibacillus cellulosilyticus]
MAARYVPHRPMLTAGMRELPAVDPTKLEHSAQSFQPMLQDASRIIGRLTERSFVVPLMTAAQAGHQQEVDRMIKSAAGTSRIHAKYTPSGIVIVVEPTNANESCCNLSMTLRWGV